MKAFGWAADDSGCCHYRIAEPLEALARTANWQIDYSTRFTGIPDGPMKPDDKRLPGIARDCAKDLDVISTQRTALMAPSTFWQHLNIAGAFTVYEIDDDLFHIDRSNVAAHKLFTRPDIRQNMIDNIAMASRVTCSTEPLAEILRKHNADVRVCPNGIPDWLLEHNPTRYDNRKVTIGWGGSPTHEMDFAEVDGQLRRFLNQRDDVEFHCLGTDYADWMRIPKDKCRFTPWVPSVPDFYQTIDYDIGIAPLRPHIFNRSKSNIKVLECAALGIPVVASDVYPYRNFIRHGETGYLVKYPHEWGKYLRELVEDPTQRAEMGAKARSLAAGYSMSQTAPIWEEALTP